LTLTSLLLVFAVSLLWAGLAPALGLAAFGIGYLIAFLMIPPEQGGSMPNRTGGRDRALLSLISGGTGLGIWLMRGINLPWTRIDLSRYVSPSIILYLVIAGVVGIVLWQLALGYRRLRAIRSRLVATFVIVVVGVALAVSVTSIVLGINTTQQRTFDQLHTAVVLKSQAVDTWLDQLRFSLESLVVEDYEVQRAQSLLLRSLTETFRLSAAQELRVRFSTVIRRTGWFTEIFLIDTNGEIVLSTNRSAEGRMVGERVYFQEALEDLHISPPEYDPLADGVTVIIARPLRLGATTYGIVAARTDMGQLRAIASTGQIGNTGTTDFVNAARIWLNEPSLSGGFIPVQSQAIRAALRRPIGIQRAIYTSHRGARVSGAYIWLPRLQTALLMEQEQTEVLSGAITTSVANAGVAILAVLVAVTIAIGFAESISRPLSDLAGTATRIAGGELDLNVDVIREDEVGAVARAFNAMTDQLRDLISGLEARVEERTRGLQAVADVSRATTSVLDPDQLLPQVVDLVQQRFDLYYVGLFLLDEGSRGHGARSDAAERAVLRAGTGAAGREMLAQGWSLTVGGDSMIGQCVATGDVVIKQQSGDAGGQDQDVVRFENRWLPDTRSELALPLRYGGSVIGAMTVQSVLPQAFDETIIAVLQNLADQVAVAVQNARLFAETQQALDRVRRAQRRYERQAWSAYLDMVAAGRDVVGYERRGGAVQALTSQKDAPLESLSAEAWGALASGKSVIRPSEDDSVDGGIHHHYLPDKGEPGHQLLVPIVQSGQIIGALGLQREQGWSTDDAGKQHRRP
jgi:HAMP domain-containing protein